MRKTTMCVCVIGVISVLALTAALLSAKGKPAPSPSQWTVTSQIADDSNTDNYNLFGDGQRTFVDPNGISYSQYLDGKKRPDGTVTSILSSNGEWVLDLSNGSSTRLVGLGSDLVLSDPGIDSDNPYMSSRCTDLGTRTVNLRQLTTDGTSIECGSYFQGNQAAYLLRVPTRWTRLGASGGTVVIEGVQTAPGCTVTEWDKALQQCSASATPIYIRYRFRLLVPEGAFSQ